MISDKIMITCRQATLFSLKKEERKISFLDRVKLAVHLIICEFCRLFEQQNKVLSHQAKHLHTDVSLSEAEKEEMERRIESSPDKK